MTYLRVLAAISRALHRLMRRVDANGAVWATLADWDGHIAFRQVDYAERVRKISPQPASVVTGSAWVTTTPATWSTGAPTITARWR